MTHLIGYIFILLIIMLNCEFKFDLRIQKSRHTEILLHCLCTLFINIQACQLIVSLCEGHFLFLFRCCPGCLRCGPSSWPDSTDTGKSNNTKNLTIYKLVSSLSDYGSRPLREKGDNSDQHEGGVEREGGDEVAEDDGLDQRLLLMMRFVMMVALVPFVMMVLGVGEFHPSQSPLPVDVNEARLEHAP